MSRWPTYRRHPPGWSDDDLHELAFEAAWHAGRTLKQATAWANDCLARAAVDPAVVAHNRRMLGLAHEPRRTAA